MLIINRKVGDSFKIGNDILVKVLGIGTENIVIGINAPKHISIQRDDMIKKIRIKKYHNKKHITPEIERELQIQFGNIANEK